MEVFKKIENYENYEVSNYGRVKSVRTGKMLKQTLGNHGYKHITLCKNGKVKIFLIHRLVAFAFVDNKHNKNVIDHKDRDKTNNHYSNLRFCTRQENNCNKSIRKNNKTGITGVRKVKNKWIAQIKHNNKHIHLGTYDSIEEATNARRQKEKEFYGEFSPN